MQDGALTFFSEHLQRIKDYQEGKITYSIIPDPNNPQYWEDGYAYGMIMGFIHAIYNQHMVKNIILVSEELVKNTYTC